MKYKDVLADVHCHVFPLVEAIIAAVVAAGSAAAGQASQNKANRARRRATGNANQMSGQGGETPTSPTATRFAEGDKSMVSPTRSEPQQGTSDLPQLPQGMRMSELLGGATPPASEMQQGQSLKPLTDTNPIETPKTDTSSTADKVSGYGQDAMALYQAYMQMKNANKIEPQPPAQLGAMNLMPTASRFGV